jgi:hypothetical protein
MKTRAHAVLAVIAVASAGCARARFVTRAPDAEALAGVAVVAVETEPSPPQTRVDVPGDGKRGAAAGLGFVGGLIFPVYLCAAGGPFGLLLCTVGIAAVPGIAVLVFAGSGAIGAAKGASNAGPLPATAGHEPALQAAVSAGLEGQDLAARLASGALAMDSAGRPRRVVAAGGAVGGATLRVELKWVGIRAVGTDSLQLFAIAHGELEAGGRKVGWTDRRYTLREVRSTEEWSHASPGEMATLLGLLAHRAGADLAAWAAEVSPPEGWVGEKVALAAAAGGPEVDVDGF